jgi:tetratricopeptide (TPR) repeat protein
MSALRAEGLIVDSMSSIEWTDLHLRKALELGRQSARDWEQIVRLDPTNQIAWNNLVDSRMTVTGLLYSIGDVRGAREQLRAALDIEQRVRDSGMIGTVMSLAAGYLARLEADAGNRQGALAALSSNQRFVALATRAVPPNSFGSVFLPEFLGNYGFPGNGLGYGALALPYGDGDYETVRRMARDSIKRMEQLKDVPAPQQRARNATLEVAYRTAADASYRLKEYAVADAEIRRAVELRKSIPPRTLGERRDEAAQASLAAMIAARLERYAEARRLIDPVLELHRELFARGDNEDLTQHIEFAQALYASALARPGGNAAELKQAAALIDALPPAMRALVSVGRIRASITDAQGS